MTTRPRLHLLEGIGERLERLDRQQSRALQLERVELCGAEILKLCVEVGGCLTGEHGVGVEKRDLMRLQYTDIDLAQQMRVKAVFDPDWLLNPGKVFPLEGRGVQ
jgi:FAD/FMN-containing dehydrogenases